MVWSIIRPQAWMLDRRLRQANPLILTTLFLIFLWGSQRLYHHLVGMLVPHLYAGDSGVIVASSLPLGIFLISLFALLGFGDTMHRLYLASDLELLLIAPVPLRTIFLFKLAQCSRAAILPAVVLGVFLAAHGSASQAPAIYFLLLFLLMLMGVILATALVMTLAILLGRYLPARRIRAWTPIIVLLLTIALMVGQQPAVRWLLTHEEILSFMAAIPSDMNRLALFALGFAVITLAFGLITLAIFERSFQESWNRYRTVPVPPMRPSRDGRRRRLAPTARAVASPMRAVLRKEWLELRRSPRWLLTVAQPVVLVAVSLILMSPMGRWAEALAFGTILGFLALLLSVQPAGMALIQMAEEGMNIWLLGSTPVSMATVMAGKLFSAWALLAIPWPVVCVAAGLLMGFPPWQTAWLVGVALWGASGTLVMATAVAGLKVDFRAEDVRQRASPLVNYVTIGVNGLFVAMTIALSGYIVAHFHPDSSLILAIRSIGELPGAATSFLNNRWLPGGLLVGQLFFWLGAALLWHRAAGGLEKWE